jgi:nicotinate-nucleotide adenylyltransferase
MEPSSGQNRAPITEVSRAASSPAGPAAFSAGGRVAFFGGSFDPPHLGHLAVARAARDALRLDAVLFVPVGAQPLKPQGSTAPFADRLAMTERAIAGEPGFLVSLADAPNSAGTPNYTLETLRTLRDELPPHGALFCLMGADSFVGLRRWRGGVDIPFAASLIVASRPGQQLDDLAVYLPYGLTLSPAPDHVTLQHPVIQQATANQQQSVLRSEHGESKDLLLGNIELRSYFIRNPAGHTAPFYLLPGLDVEISASEIRSQVRSASDHRAPGQELLPASVAEYIRTHGLYR